MAERIKARAASIDAQGNELHIVLTFDDGGERKQVAYTYSGDDVQRFGKELLRQKERGEAKARVELAKVLGDDESTVRGVQ